MGEGGGKVRNRLPNGGGVRIRPAHCRVGANAQGYRLKQDELSSLVVGGTERGGVRMRGGTPFAKQQDVSAPRTRAPSGVPPPAIGSAAHPTPLAVPAASCQSTATVPAAGLAGACANSSGTLPGLPLRASTHHTVCTRKAVNAVLQLISGTPSSSLCAASILSNGSRCSAAWPPARKACR